MINVLYSFERGSELEYKYPSFTFLSFEFQSRVLVLSILYYIYTYKVILHTFENELVSV